MPRVCYICGKGKVSGNQVSHSHIATKRTWSANLQKKAIEVDGKVENKYICTRCLKTLKKED
ncbi:MAG TPA: 50S ribosomal protein L28 [Clostridiales bacterium]|nr:50S ribosomal protein L28 [Clostridiales bacterium]